MASGVIAAIGDLDWNSTESRERAAAALGASSASESLIAALFHVMTWELRAARSAAAAAIVRVDRAAAPRRNGLRECSPDSLLVGRALMDALCHERSPVREAAATAIADEFDARLATPSPACPDWFLVLKIHTFGPIVPGMDRDELHRMYRQQPYRFQAGPDDETYHLAVSEQARALTGALASLTRDVARAVRDAAVAALQVIERMLAIQLRQGTVDVTEHTIQQEQQEQQQQQQQQQRPQFVRQVQPPVYRTADEEQVARDAVRAATAAIPSPRRYTSLALYQGGRRKENAVSPAVPLREGTAYQLEVAVRYTPGPISTVEAQHPVAEPGQKQPVRILAVLEGRGFAIAQEVQALILPPEGESTQNAWFEVTPIQKSRSAGDVAEIRVRLYFEFNLLDVLTLRAEVAGKFDEGATSAFGTAQPLVMRQDRQTLEYVDLEHVRPRSMHIDITRDGPLYAFHFVFRNETNREMTMNASVRLQATDLEDQLIAIRRYWYDIAMGSVFAAKVDGTGEDLLPVLRKLAQAGRRLWTALFERESKSAIYEIGQWLLRRPLANDSVIQVSVSVEATDFVFPWSVLYDRDVPKEEYAMPDAEGFWGVRYCVEQRLPKPFQDDDTPVKPDPQIRIAFMLWEQFRNAARQKALMRGLVAECTGKLQISDPAITDAAACYRLLADCESDLLYFYSHGYTRLRESNAAGSANLQAFLQAFEALPKDAPARAYLGPLHDAVTKHDYTEDRSWIGLSFGMLYLDELYGEVKELRSRPMVILNMCESAQVTPSLRDSFVDFFLDRGARSVIGTECPMTVEFADVFSESLFRALLMGRSIGNALLDARRDFLRRNNPLALAYTLFGSASAAFAPPVLVQLPVAAPPTIQGIQ
jgi:hypothetical protein